MFRCNFSAHAWLLVAALLPLSALAADPCAEPHARSLVLGSGGSKGAFEAGAIYHLVVHRGCDFSEISGNSIGALNGALLAQAPVSDDHAQSLENMREAAESLIARWSAIESARQVMRPRPLGKVRFGLFGLESVDDFDPLRNFVRTRVSLDRLRNGRELRIGTMSFDDGRYREIVINRNGHVDRATAHEYIYGSAIVPVFGEMPLIASPTDPTQRLRFADGGLRNPVPVASYFKSCRRRPASAPPVCSPLTGVNTPSHLRTEQLFVIVTSPYTRGDDLRPMLEPKAAARGSRRRADGRQILVRTFDLLIDTAFRNDLNRMLLLNDLLRWQTQSAENANALSPFPIASFNTARAPEGATLPYEIALIAPQREDSDPMTIFDFDRATMQRQLYCGCAAADRVMQSRFGLAPQQQACARRFPPPPISSGGASWPASICSTPSVER